MIGIYKITSPSGKIYIGQSWQIEQRHKWYRCNGAPEQQKLNNSFKKYGIANHLFETVLTFEKPTQNQLDSLEIYLIRMYENLGFEMLNIAYGGGGGRISEEAKKRLSEMNKGANHPQFGRKKSVESIAKRAATIANSGGYKPTEETRKKQSESLKALKRKMPPDQKQKLISINTGRVVSEETREKIRAKLKGRKLTPEHAAKIALAIRLNHPRWGVPAKKSFGS